MSQLIQFNLNEVILITSPRADEKGLERRLVESIKDISENGGHFNFTHAPLYAGDGFFQFLEEVYYRIEAGLKPLIHIDMHGCERRGLEIGENGDYVDWQYVVDALRILNEKLNNQLIVLITACHGLHAILPINFQKSAPFLCIFAPEEEITFADIEDKVPQFYSELFSTGSLDSALEKLGGKFTLFNSVEFLFKVLTVYIERECQGKGGRERREGLLTQIMQTSLGDAPEMIGEYRGFVKDYIKPDQALLDRFTGRFLMGKASEIKIEDLLAAIDKG